MSFVGLSVVDSVRPRLIGVDPIPTTFVTEELVFMMRVVPVMEAEEKKALPRFITELADYKAHALPYRKPVARVWVCRIL
ncbi:hypothetical protein R1sor_009204 [Riccia sorocarpa]|uniref:Uncharacterized protein n=1 Tax=Riccia sorocarpa TaxID=122646 RepID=A0ABD3H8N0_9MARC